MRTTTVLGLLLIGCTPPLNLGSSEVSVDSGCFGQIGGQDAGFESPFSSVVEPLKAPPAISGGTLVVLNDDTVVVADPDRDRVYVVTASNQVTPIAMTANDEPGRVAAGPADRVFVALRRADQVAEIDLVLKTVVARHDVCQAPRGLAWSARTQQLYVACATGGLTKLTFTGAGSMLTLQSTTNLHPADDLRDVVVVPDGVLVSTFRTARVIKVLDDDTVVAQPFPKADVTFVTDSFGKELEFVSRVAWRMVATSDGVALLHQRHQLTPIPDSCSSSYGTNNGPGKADAVILDMAPTTLNSTALPRTVLPVDLAISVDQENRAIVGAGSLTINVWRKGSASAGFVEVRLDDLKPRPQPTAVGFRSGGKLVVFSRQPAQLLLIDRDKNVVPLSLATTDVTSTGHDLFHLGTPSAIACASCHPEAGDDGHVWRLPDGPRRTPSLRGGLTGTAPFHWAGDQADMDALFSDVFARRMGGTAQSPARTQATLRWLDTQAALPVSKSLDPMAVSRGKALFTGVAACANCHAGEKGTNNLNANVGTGKAFQVPRLVELSYRAPYFHDGRVPSLEARFFEDSGGELHGSATQLSPSQLADLVVYLKSR